MPRSLYLCAFLLCAWEWEAVAAASLKSVEVPVEIVQAEPSFTVERCEDVVASFNGSKKVPEQQISPKCQGHMKSEKCGFFAQALSLAIGHPNFDSKHFCAGMVNAHFCSETMDNLLLSQSVSDLAHGACRRAERKEGDKSDKARYCDKFQFMLLHAVKSHDLDTMRACYMMEVENFEANMTAQESETVTTTPSPLQAAGSQRQNVSLANSTAAAPGCGNSTDSCGKAAPAPAASKPSAGQTIIVRPSPTGSNQTEVQHASQTHPQQQQQQQQQPAQPQSQQQQQQQSPNGSIVTTPVKPASTIITMPVPATVVSNLGTASVRTLKAVEAVESADRPLVQPPAPALAAQPLQPAGQSFGQGTAAAPQSLPQSESEAAPDPSKSVLVVPFDRLPELAAAFAAKGSEGSGKLAADMRSAFHANVQVRSALWGQKQAVTTVAPAMAPPVAISLAASSTAQTVMAAAPKQQAVTTAAPARSAPVTTSVAASPAARTVAAAATKLEAVTTTAPERVSPVATAGVASVAEQTTAAAATKLEATAASSSAALPPAKAAPAAPKAAPLLRQLAVKEAALAALHAKAAKGKNATAQAEAAARAAQLVAKQPPIAERPPAASTARPKVAASAPAVVGLNSTAANTTALIAMATVVTTGAQWAPAASGASPTTHQAAVNATLKVGKVSKWQSAAGGAASAPPGKSLPIVKKELKVKPLKWNFTPMAALRVPNRTNSTTQAAHINSTWGNSSISAPLVAATSSQPRSLSGNRTVAGLLAKEERVEKRGKAEKVHYDGFLSKFVR